MSILFLFIAVALVVISLWANSKYVSPGVIKQVFSVILIVILIIILLVFTNMVNLPLNLN